MTTAVRTALRCRPFVQREIDQGCSQTFGKLDTTSHTAHLRNGGAAYAFDWVFDQSTPQVDVYNCCIKDGLDHLLEGYNFTVFAYGQTGSGKTYTMGTDHKSTQIATSDVQGIIPRAMQELFNRIFERKHAQKIEVNVSFIELYEGKVLDLLKGKKELQIRERKAEVYAHGAERAPASSAAEVLAQLAVGSRNRATGGTAMNALSSRSHAVFTVYLKITDANDELDVKRAKCNLVDLAGSEKLAKTKATGDRQREGININVGLFCLGQVIDELTSNSQHVSYRNNNLTRLLQDSLGGNAHTVFIACVSPADSAFDETASTLGYAARARRIKNKPVVNVDPLTAELFRLKQENAELRRRCDSSELKDLQKLLSDQALQISQLKQENDALRCSNEAAKKVQALASAIQEPAFGRKNAVSQRGKTSASFEQLRKDQASMSEANTELRASEMAAAAVAETADGTRVQLPSCTAPSGCPDGTDFLCSRAVALYSQIAEHDKTKPSDRDGFFLALLKSKEYNVEAVVGHLTKICENSGIPIPLAPGAALLPATPGPSFLPIAPRVATSKLGPRVKPECSGSYNHIKRATSPEAESRITKWQKTLEEKKLPKQEFYDVSREEMRLPDPDTTKFKYWPTHGYYPYLRKERRRAVCEDLKIRFEEPGLLFDGRSHYVCVFVDVIGPRPLRCRERANAPYYLCNHHKRYSYLSSVFENAPLTTVTTAAAAVVAAFYLHEGRSGEDWEQHLETNKKVVSQIKKHLNPKELANILFHGEKAPVGHSCGDDCKSVLPKLLGVG